MTLLTLFQLNLEDDGGGTLPRDPIYSGGLYCVAQCMASGLITYSNADVASISYADFYHITTDQILCSGLEVISAGSTYSTYFPICATSQVGLYRVIWRDALFNDTTQTTDINSEVFGLQRNTDLINVWRIGNHADQYLENQDYSFRELPHTWFHETDNTLYAGDTDPTTVIPSGCDYYIFPVEAVWTDTAPEEFFTHFNTCATAGVTVPATYIRTDVGVGGMVDEVCTLLSGLGLLQTSTTGSVIFVDDYKAVHTFWQAGARTTYNGIVDTWNTNYPVDIIFYDGQSSFSRASDISDRFTYSGDLQFGTDDWQIGYQYHLHNIASESLVNTTHRKYSEPYHDMMLMMSGLSMSFEAGAIWTYIQELRDHPQTTFVRGPSNRSLTSDEATLLKGICLMADSVYSPGTANYTQDVNYSEALYTKYAIGDPTSPPYLSDTNTIYRRFTGGEVTIYDDGTPFAVITVSS